MFLAWKEIRHSKAKFGLIISVVALVSYLVYFLTSLAYGLASSYTNGVTKWKADEIVLTVDSNNNVMMSFMNNEDYDSIDVQDGKRAKLGLFPAVIKDADDDTKDTREEIYVFGIEENSFIAPKEVITSGLEDNEIIADSGLKELGYAVDDNVRVAGTSLTWKIVAFTEKATYQTAPILYANLATWRELRYGSSSSDLFSAVVVQGTATLSSDTPLQVYSISEFISNLPGYNAQVATFSIMIGFLIVIVAFVLGIFIYVLTIQKTSMFGVMKAQGISNLFIGNSVVAQTIIVTGIGVAIGLILTLISGYFLGGFVPFAINPLFYIGITIAFFLFSILGGLFSVRAVLKIDPLKAIG